MTNVVGVYRVKWMNMGMPLRRILVVGDECCRCLQSQMDEHGHAIVADFGGG